MAELHLKANNIYFMALGDNLFGITAWNITDQSAFHSWFIEQSVFWAHFIILQDVIYVPDSHLSFSLLL